MRRRALLPLLVLGACGGSHRPFAGGPLLQSAGPTSMVVTALTGDRAEVAELRWSSADGRERGVVREQVPATSHELRIDGLTPDTAYVYSLEVPGGRSLGTGTFRTFPLPGPVDRPVRIAAIGDTGLTRDRSIDGRLKELVGRGQPPRRQRMAAAAIAPLEPLLLLHLGDVEQEDGRAHRYREAFLAPMAGLISRVPVYPVIGNHDAKTGAVAYLTAFHLPENAPPADRERYYSFDCGPVHVTALDVCTSPFGEGSAQRAWLEDDLAAAASAPWRIVILHVPPISASRTGDNPEIGAALVPVFERHRVDLVLSGHHHNYQRFAPRNGVTYVVSGGALDHVHSVAPDPRLARWGEIGHFLVIEVDRVQLTLEAHDLSGVVFDRHAIVR